MKKQPHQQTQAEYVRSLSGRKYKDSFGREQVVGANLHDKRLSAVIHESHVKRALVNRKRVPERVLADYPGLVEAVQDRIGIVRALRKLRPGTEIGLVRHRGLNEEREPVEFRKLDANGVEVLVKENGKNRRYPIHMIDL